MKIAIQHREGEEIFSDRWIKYCKINSINYKVVNVFDNDIVKQCEGCSAFMWHHHPGIFKEVLVAKKILFALEHAGIKVFPDFKTGWHFDDKVAQKYLLEAIGVPLVPSFVFYDKKQALDWAAKISYPKVFKLKGGAGSANVKLVNSENKAIKLINKSFGKGFAQFDRLANFKERVRRFKSGQDGLIGILKGIARLFIITDFARQQAPERGYAYFQEFIPNNNCDIRVIVVGEKAFAIKRMVRENDFRASGSGLIIYEKREIEERFVELAFQANQLIGSSSIAFDFIIDEENKPLIVEISYGYAVEAYDDCPGYWDSNMKWHDGKFNPQDWMIDNIINSIREKCEG